VCVSVCVCVHARVALFPLILSLSLIFSFQLVADSEWTSGVAAGGTAALMVLRQWRDSAEALENVQELRQFLNSSVVGQPLVRRDSTTEICVSLSFH
jgi:hypothetical protein